MSPLNASDVELLFEVRRRGLEKELGDYDDYELEQELENRGYVVHHKVQDKYVNELKELLEEKGYHVFKRDPERDMLEEMYYNAIFFAPTEFMKYMNDLFMKRLHKWI